MGKVTAMNSKNDNGKTNGNSSAMKEAAAVRNSNNNSNKATIPTNEPSSYLPPQPEQYAEAVMNMTLFDPPRWGWTAVGGISDLLSPHEVSFD